MKDSLWYHQVGKRAERLTEMMEDSSETILELTELKNKISLLNKELRAE